MTQDTGRMQEKDGKDSRQDRVAEARGLITVIVPFHDAREYLPCCLASLAGQSHRNLEVLLVDDGSKDGGAALCESWCAKDGRFRLLRQEKGGVSAARNRGLAHASGEYVAFVDADDWLMPGILEKQLLCLEQEGSDMVLCGFREVGEPDRVRFMKEHGEEKGQTGTAEGAFFQSVPSCVTVDAETYAAEYLLQGNTRCWSILFSRAILAGRHFQEGLTIGEDMLFLMDLLPVLRRVSVMEDREYCYYINERGAMFSAFRPSYMDQIICWKEAGRRMEKIYPRYMPLVDVCLFQAALLVAGKLAVSPKGTGAGARESGKGFLSACHEAARGAWVRLGRKGRKRLPAGYRLKGVLFLRMPKLYMRSYHVWKG